MDVKHFFKSSGFVHSGLIPTDSGEDVDFSQLPPFLRVLMTTDGTVTKSLESFFWEPVRVENLAQGNMILKQNAPAIDRKAGESVFRRQIQLRGTNTQQVYAKATSLICLESLSAEIAASLEQGKVGIGELLRECGLETYREIIKFGTSNFSDNDKLTRLAVWRTYRIVMQHKSFIQVTETFPLDVYQTTS